MSKYCKFEGPLDPLEGRRARNCGQFGPLGLREKHGVEVLVGAIGRLRLDLGTLAPLVNARKARVRLATAVSFVLAPKPTAVLFC